MSVWQSWSIARQRLILSASLAVLFALGSHGNVDAQQVAALQGELELIREQIRAAEVRDAELAGGVVKALVQTRMEILKTTEALLHQRIQAVESGAPITIEVPASQPNPELAAQLADEIVQQRTAIDAARKEESQHTGGLVLAMKLSTIATQEQTLALLQQRYFAAQYGLPVPGTSAAHSSEDVDSAVVVAPSAEPAGLPKAAEKVVTVRILGKRLQKVSYEEYVYFDLEYTATGLDKPARAIKGVMQLQDLFGETKLRIGWTIDEPMQPGERRKEGGGFEYNQFRDAHQWAAGTDKENMMAVFEVESILYTDGTRSDL